jgi:hypothetical protein
MSKTYRKFDSSIQDAIIQSGNINLFPHLNFPRSTALSWIRTGRKVIKFNMTSDVGLLDKIKSLELEKERAKNYFTKELISKLTDKEKLFSKNKKEVVKTIEKFKKWNSINGMCRSIGMNSNTFYRYRIEINGCPRINYKSCKILSPNQLTFREQEKIHDLANDRSLFHLSVKGLQYYAFRNKILSCGYDSWRKYVREFKLENRLRKKKKKKYREGIRAKKINEIWHIDVTEFKLKNGEKAYLQAVMDNYSRKIIHWNLSSNKKASLSVSTMLEATKLNCPEVLMSDGGGENTSINIKKLLHGKGILSLIAKKDILFSNSMIESFFNTLKNRYLNRCKRYTFSKLYKQICRSVNYFNNAALSVLHGARPNELFEDKVLVSDLKSKLRGEIINAKEIRHIVNKRCFRQRCSL